jgi:hypothetical protein
MIDWLNVLFNSIWILGAAIALAVLSIAYYQSQRVGEKLGKTLSRSGFSLYLNIAGILFALGMALTSPRWWEILLWVIVLGGFLFQTISNIKYKI